MRILLIRPFVFQTSVIHQPIIEKVLKTIRFAIVFLFKGTGFITFMLFSFPSKRQTEKKLQLQKRYLLWDYTKRHVLKNEGL